MPSFAKATEGSFRRGAKTGVPSVAPEERRMARWMGLEPMTDGLENRCSIRLSYHRLKPVTDGISFPSSLDKGKAHAVPLRHRHLPIVLPTIQGGGSAGGGIAGGTRLRLRNLLPADGDPHRPKRRRAPRGGQRDQRLTSALNWRAITAQTALDLPFPRSTFALLSHPGW